MRERTIVGASTACVTIDHAIHISVRVGNRVPADVGSGRRRGVFNRLNGYTKTVLVSCQTRISRENIARIILVARNLESVGCLAIIWHRTLGAWFGGIPLHRLYIEVLLLERGRKDTATQEHIRLTLVSSSDEIEFHILEIIDNSGNKSLNLYRVACFNTKAVVFNKNKLDRAED